MYYKKCIVVVYDVQYFYCHNILEPQIKKICRSSEEELRGKVFESGHGEDHEITDLVTPTPTPATSEDEEDEDEDEDEGSVLEFNSKYN